MNQFEIVTKDAKYEVRLRESFTMGPKTTMTLDITKSLPQKREHSIGVDWVIDGEFTAYWNGLSFDMSQKTARIPREVQVEMVRQLVTGSSAGSLVEASENGAAREREHIVGIVQAAKGVSHLAAQKRVCDDILVEIL
jgi:hypothetical protein